MDDLKTPEIGKGKAGPGRPKGLLNRTTRAAKEAIALAADELGGAERMVAWVKEDPKNEHSFWTTIYPKLIPIDTNINGNLNLVSKVERTIIRANASDTNR